MWKSSVFISELCRGLGFTVSLLHPSQVSAGEAGKAMVRELVHGFLLELCCSLKHGINFYDAYLGTFGR